MLRVCSQGCTSKVCFALIKGIEQWLDNHLGDQTTETMKTYLVATGSFEPIHTVLIRKAMEPPVVSAQLAIMYEVQKHLRKLHSTTRNQENKIDLELNIMFSALAIKDSLILSYNSFFLILRGTGLKASTLKTHLQLNGFHNPTFQRLD